MPPSSTHRMTGWVAISCILWRMRMAPIRDRELYMDLFPTSAACSTSFSACTRLVNSFCLSSTRLLSCVRCGVSALMYSTSSAIELTSWSLCKASLAALQMLTIFRTSASSWVSRRSETPSKMPEKLGDIWKGHLPGTMVKYMEGLERFCRDGKAGWSRNSQGKTNLERERER